jgi:hypothetical protein
VKAITILQPWATLIATGSKSYETRSWATSHRGEIAIHAGQTWSRDYARICTRSPFLEELSRDGYMIDRYLWGPHGRVRSFGLPLGKVVAVAELVEVIPVERVSGLVNPRETAFGDFSRGRYAWKLSNIRRLREPYPAKGRQGVWDILGEAEDVLRTRAAS